MVCSRSALAALCLMAACGDPDKAPPADSAVVAPGPDALDSLGATHLVLIHVDTLRADHMPWYGGSRPTFPRLAQRRWTVVDGYTATSSWTATATASVLSGATTAQHGVLYSTFDGVDIGGGSVNRKLELPTLAEHLAGQGFETALFTGNAFVGESSGLNKGFDHTVEMPETRRSSNAGELVRTALEWVDVQSSGAPMFLMLQPLDPHLPYSPADADYGTWTDTENALISPDLPDHEMEELYRALLEDPATRDQARAELVNLYDEQLLGLDRSIEALLVGLDERGLLQDTLVVLAADHGESLGELDFSQFGHGKSDRPEVLQVPLMFLAREGAPERVSCLSSGADLAPTLTRALGLDVMRTPDGQPMQARCRAATFSSYALPQGLMFASAQDREHMLIAHCDSGSIEALDLLADPYGAVTVDPSPLGELAEELAAGLAASAALTELGACAGLR